MTWVNDVKVADHAGHPAKGFVFAAVAGATHRATRCPPCGQARAVGHTPRTGGVQAPRAWVMPAGRQAWDGPTTNGKGARRAPFPIR